MDIKLVVFEAGFKRAWKGNEMNRSDAVEFVEEHARWLSDSWGTSPEGRKYMAKFNAAVAALNDDKYAGAASALSAGLGVKVGDATYGHDGLPWPQTMDANAWATEFCKRNSASDHGTLLGWFANAIMIGHDTAIRKEQVKNATPNVQIERPDYCNCGPGETAYFVVPYHEHRPLQGEQHD